MLLIKATLAANKKGKSEFSALFKIFANHIQLLVLVLSFELEWPPEVQGLLGVLQPVADVSQRLLSLDCFLSVGGEGYFIPRVYAYLLLYLLLPIVLVVGAVLFWRIKAGQRGWVWASSRAITTVIVLFFLVHSAVTSRVFAIFHCRSIVGEERLVADLEILCYTGTHLLWAAAGGGLGLFLWVAGIPLVSFAILIDKRKQLGNTEVR